MNHVIDPTYFFDALEGFSFDYNIFYCNGTELTPDGKQKLSYDRKVIRGSIQSQGFNVTRDKKGNKRSWDYNFYCKSKYRININDIIEYNHKYLCVTGIRDYDEYGVRKAMLTMVDLSAYHDFAEYLRFLNGEEHI